MNCKCCNKVVSDTMIFCPYCGNKIGGDKNEAINDTEMREKILILYKDAKYQEILNYALEGDIIAKNYYIRYVMYRADQSQLSNDEELINTLKQNIESGSMFAKAALGIYKFYHGKRGVLGITDDSAIAMGRQLIRESAESDEPAAMTIFAEWLLKGDGVDKDEFAAYKMIKSVAEKGYPPAMYTLGLWHCQEIAGISKNEEFGNELIEKAAFFGDKSAQNYIRKKDSNWLDMELAYAISDEDMKSTMSLISPETNEMDVAIQMSLYEEYGKCQDKEDYIRLYKLLRDKYADDERTNDLFLLLKQFIINITGYSLDTMSLEEAKAFEDVRGRISELTDRYECLQHYLHLKEDIKTLEIDILDEDLPSAMRNVSKDLREKCHKEVDEYIEYSKAKEDAKWEGFGCFLTFCVIVAIIGFMIFPIIGWVAGGFVLLSIIAKKSNESRYKKICKTYGESYLLVNELIGYGYSLLTDADLDPKYNYGKYNDKEAYNNPIPSVLSKNIIMETKNKVSGE